MTPSYDHLLAFVLEHPWSVTRPMLATIADILAHRLAGVERDRAEIEAALVNRKNLPQPRAGSVAVIPVYGVIAPRMNLMSDISGGTTFERLSQQLSQAMADPSVRNIVLDVDSPGGSVAGNAEFADEILRARKKKPIIAVAQYTMGSAAYHLSAAATEIVASPSARVGSVGTYSIHNDLSEALAKLGVKRTYISAGEGKVDGNEAEPLSEAALARIQASVDEAYEQFVANVVRGRGQGTSVEKVKNEWKAFVYSAREALTLGMIDRVATLNETLAELLADSPDASDRRLAEDMAATGAVAAPTVTQDSAALALERQVFELQLQPTTKRD